ncbi:MAG: choice-of-anchor D domain-containing protein [Bacteroidetes bacterium]|nr:choice-of-anchor D domain-containing protein [Bacteroidota bacterium]
MQAERSFLRRCLRLVPILLGVCVPAASGQTWTKVNFPVTSPVTNLYCVHFISKTLGMVGGVAGANGRLYRTVDGGVTWNQVALPGAPTAINDIHFVDANNGEIVGDGLYVAVTKDAGVTWALRSLTTTVWAGGGDVTAVYFKDAANGFAVGKAPGAGTGAKLARTADTGKTWTNIALNAAPANNLYDIDFFDANKGVVVGTGTPPRKSWTQNGGTTWTAVDSVGGSAPFTLSFYGVDAVNGTGVGYAAGGQVVIVNPIYGEVRKTVDTGRTWQTVAGMTNGVPAGNTQPLNGVIAVTQNLVFAAASNYLLYRTSDGGTTWTRETLPVRVPATTPDLHRFSRTPTDQLYLVGLSGTVLTYQIAPNATFSTSQLTYPRSCPGDSPILQVTIGNDGGVPLLIDSILITQPVTPGVNYVITARPTSVNPGATGTVTIRADIAPGATAGVFNGLLRIFNNDENRTGSDTIKGVNLSVTVANKTVQVNGAVPTNAGRLRVGPAFSKAFVLTDLLNNNGECDINVTVRLAQGIDFRIDPPQLTKLTPGQNGTVRLSFEPQGPCERYDTLIIDHDGQSPASPVRIPITGLGTVQSFSTNPADTLDFGGVLLSLTTSQNLILLNNKLRQACLDTTNMYSFAIAGPNASDFTTTFSISGGRYPVGPQAQVQVPITAAPSAPGQRIAYAIISHDLNLSPPDPDTVVLVVKGLKPEVTTANSEMRFALTEVGGRRDTSAHNFLVNPSNAEAQIIDATIVGPNASDFKYNGPSPSFSLVPGAAKDVDVSFMPTSAGVRTATLQLKSSLGSNPLLVNLIGDGGRASGGTQKDVVVFPSTSAGACRDTVLSQFIYNTSSLPLRIVSAALIPDAAGTPGDESAFTLLAPSIPPDLVVAPGDSASITLRFCPGETKPYIARLVLENNSDASPFSIQLIGTGRGSKVTGVDSVIFAPTRVLTQRDSTVETMLVNREAGPVTVDSVVISGADAQSFTFVTPQPPFVLPPSQATAVKVRFNPQRRDRHYAILNVYSTGGRHGTLVLAGQAIYPLLEILPDRSTSLRVRLGESRRLRINIVNIGDDSGQVASATLNGSSAFSNVSTDPVPARLFPRDTLKMFVDFNPATFCDHAVTVAIRGEGVRGIYALADTSVEFSGLGVAPVVNTAKPTINFGIRQGTGPFDSTLANYLGNTDFNGNRGLCLDSTTIDSMTITGANAADFAFITPVAPLSPTGLGPAAFAPLAVRFQPATQGIKTAELRVYFDENPDSVRHIPLIGASALLPIVYGPYDGMFQIDFGRVRVGTIRDSTFTATNTTASPFTIDALSSSLPSEIQILSPLGSFQMLPGTPVPITVRFAPTAVGVHGAYTQFRKGTVTDSSFSLIGTGIDQALRAEIDSVDFGTLATGTQADSTVRLLNTPTAAIASASFLDSVAIESAAIVTGASNFDLLRSPNGLAANGTDSIGVRFRSFGATGRRDGIARIRYNRRNVGGIDREDSLDVALTGFVKGELWKLTAGLGANATGSPGDTVRYPIVLSGDVAGAAFDTLDVRLGFRKTLLKPLSVAAVQAGVAPAFIPPPDERGTTDGLTTIRLVNPNGFTGGTLAEVVFEVLLGDSMETMVRYDSISAFMRSNVVFATDSVRFAINEFCDARGRLIRFDSLLSFASKPNPASRTGSFSYTLPALVHAQLTIYDAAGREVKRLVDAEQGPGYFIVPLDASNLARGTYYCVLRAGRFIKSLTLQILD